MSTYSSSFPMAFSFLYATIIGLSVLQIGSSSLPNSMKVLFIGALAFLVLFGKFGYYKLARRA